MFEKPTDLVKAHTIAAMCQAYADSQRDIAEAFRLLGTARERLNAVFSVNEFGGVSFLPHSIYEGALDRAAEESAVNVRKSTWGFLLRMTGVLEMIAVKQREELDRQVSGGTSLPELTEDNVWNVLNKLGDDLPAMLETALKEVFDFLRPNGHWARYKTNSDFKVGRRVIIPGGFDTSYGMCRLCHYKEPFVQALDNVFHLLDGKGIARYPDNLTTAISGAVQKRRWECETDYFKCQWYKVGTLHIEFKRIDLVDELNLRAGGVVLPGPEHKRPGQAATA